MREAGQSSLNGTDLTSETNCCGAPSAASIEPPGGPMGPGPALALAPLLHGSDRFAGSRDASGGPADVAAGRGEREKRKGAVTWTIRTPAEAAALAEKVIAIWKLLPELSMKQVAERCRCTKGAVAGIIHRAGLNDRGSPVTKRAKNTITPKPKLAPRAIPRIAKVAAVPAAVKPPPSPVLPRKITYYGPEGGISPWDLCGDPDACCFPVSEGRPWRFCGAHRAETGLYCTGHRADTVAKLPKAA